MVRWQPSINTLTKRPTGNKVPVTTRRFTVTIIDEFPKVDGYNQDK